VLRLTLQLFNYRVILEKVSEYPYFKRILPLKNGSLSLNFDAYFKIN